MYNEKILKKKALCDALDITLDAVNSRKEYLESYFEDQEKSLKDAKENNDEWAIERYERELKDILFQNDALKLIETTLEKLL